MKLKYEYSYEIDEDTGCWLVTSHKPHLSGYVYINRGYRRGYLHRLLYEEKHGKIPAGYQLRHMCPNRHCINPEHLYLKQSSSL